MRCIVDSLFCSINRGRQLKNMGLSMGLSKLEEEIYGVQRGSITTIVGGTGSGKSTLALYSYVYKPLQQLLGDPKLKIVYYSLEMSSEILFAKLLSIHIWEKYGMAISYKKLLGLHKDHIMSDHEYEIVCDCREWLEAVEKHMIVYDKELTANKLYNHLKGFLSSPEIGTFVPVSETQTRYEPVKEDMYIIVLIDHVRLLQFTGTSPKPEIDKATKYLIYLRNKCNITVVLVQQQNRNASGMDRRKGGYQDIELSDLSDTSDTAQASEYVIGIFNPKREKMANYRDYRINGGLKDRFRAITVLKNRFGVSDLSVGTAFYGEIGYFKELPAGDRMSDKDYTTVMEYLNTSVFIEEEDDDMLSGNTNVSLNKQDIVFRL